MTTPEEFWSPWEEAIDSYESAMEFIARVSSLRSTQDRLFAWRGQVDAAWSLHSSLYRRLSLTLGAPPFPGEEAMLEEESRILADVHRWGLHHSESGRSSILGQLAMLQHYGAPTRLVDVSFNALVGLWFAVEKRWDDGQIVHEDHDGRLFAIDVRRRLINEDDERRAWEDDTSRPWPHEDGSNNESYEWKSQVLAWRPPHTDRRMAAQNGAFIFGGVPFSGTNRRPIQWKTIDGDEYISMDDVLGAVSLRLRPHRVNVGPGAPPDQPTYTARIKSHAKAEIRTKLEQVYGFRHATLFPDYSGFAEFGVPYLKRR